MKPLASAVSMVTCIGSSILLHPGPVWYFFPPFVGTQTKFVPVSSWSDTVTFGPLPPLLPFDVLPSGCSCGCGWGSGSGSGSGVGIVTTTGVVF